MVERAALIRYLRAWLDAQLSFKEHTTEKCQTAIINYLCTRIICHLLKDSVCKTLLLSPCVSHLNYANALLYGLPTTTIDKYQRIQDMCAHLILERSKRSVIIPLGFNIYIAHYIMDSCIILILFLSLLPTLSCYSFYARSILPLYATSYLDNQSLIYHLLIS